MERVRNNEEEEGEDVAMSGQQRGGGCNYGDALYWDARYLEEGGAAFDWYQRYAALRPFVRKFVQTSSRVLMVGCGSALMSEDMIKDGYAEIMNIDISAIVIEMMKRKYAVVRQLKYMQMDVRDMSFFSDGSFDCVIDKGTLDSLMCGPDAPLSAAQMIQEVNRLLKPGGIFILITYGDPSARVHHMNQEGCCWKIVLYVMPRPGFQVRPGSSSRKSFAEPVPLTEKGQLPAGFIPEDPDSHYIYICRTLDSLMCGPDAPLSAAQMIQEVNRLLKPGGIFILITYGDPSARVHHMNQEGCCWKIVLYVMPRPGFQVRPGSSSRKSFAEPVPLTEKGQLPAGFIPEDPDSHYIYICSKLSHGLTQPLVH